MNLARCHRAVAVSMKKPTGPEVNQRIEVDVVGRRDTRASTLARVAFDHDVNYNTSSHAGGCSAVRPSSPECSARKNQENNVRVRNICIHHHTHKWPSLQMWEPHAAIGTSERKLLSYKPRLVTSCLHAFARPLIRCENDGRLRSSVTKRRRLYRPSIQVK